MDLFLLPVTVLVEVVVEVDLSRVVDTLPLWLIFFLLLLAEPTLLFPLLLPLLYLLDPLDDWKRVLLYLTLPSHRWNAVLFGSNVTKLVTKTCDWPNTINKLLRAPFILSGIFKYPDEVGRILMKRVSVLKGACLFFVVLICLIYSAYCAVELWSIL